MNTLNCTCGKVFNHKKTLKNTNTNTKKHRNVTNRKIYCIILYYNICVSPTLFLGWMTVMRSTATLGGSTLVWGLEEHLRSMDKRNCHGRSSTRPFTLERATKTTTCFREAGGTEASLSTSSIPRLERCCTMTGEGLQCLSF